MLHIEDTTSTKYKIKENVSHAKNPLEVIGTCNLYKVEVHINNPIIFKGIIFLIDNSFHIKNTTTFIVAKYVKYALNDRLYDQLPDVQKQMVLNKLISYSKSI
jgi:hypothetical protein